MRFLIADTFQKSLARLDGQSQALVKQAAFDFQVNPKGAGTSLHKLDRARDKRFWSFRVNLDLRIIVHRTEELFMLCYADHHDQAYAWAETRKLETHPQTGAAQFVEVVEKVEEVVRRVVRDVETAPPIFAKHDADYLLSLGVPPEWLDAVRAVDEENIHKVLEHLPSEAAERLLQLACGEPVPRPTASGSKDPFEHPDAQRRFRVLDNQEALRRALDAPWEQWIVFLHPTQRGVVERSFKGPARVSGSAGTGKTVVALHRAAHLLARNPKARVLLTSFSRTLAVRLAEQADHLLGASSKERARLTIDHLHKVAKDLWAARTKRTFSPADGKKITGLLEQARGRVPGAASLGLPFLKAEWDALIDPWGIRSWPSYKSASRTGRATPLGARQRLVLWKVFEDVQRTLADRGQMTWSALCYEVATAQSGAPRYDHVIADECQDFGPAELVLLRALVGPGENDLFLCGDAGQRIFRGPLAWSQVGIDVRGRSTRLTVNYRTTEQIRKLADGLLPSGIDQGDGSKESRATVSLLNGPPPEVRRYPSQGKEIEGVAAWIGELRAAGYQPRDIGIFARTDGLLRDRADLALAKAGLTGHQLSDEQAPSVHDASLGTMHRAKGLEFKVVIVMGCDDDVLPLAYAQKELVDEADREVFVEQERQLLYVACTRARERLLVTCVGKGSRFLVGD